MDLFDDGAHRVFRVDDKGMLMSGFWKAFQTAREMQQRTREYEEFKAQPITERLLEHVQNVVNRTGQAMLVRLDGAPDKGAQGWIEIRPRSSTDQTRFRQILRDQTVDMDTILSRMAGEADKLNEPVDR